MAGALLAGDFFFGHARAFVGHRDPDGGAVGVQAGGHGNGMGGAGVADGVADQVGQGAVEQGGVGADLAGFGNVEGQRGSGMGFAIPGSAGDGPHVGDFELDGSAMGGPGEGEEFVDQGGHFVEFLAKIGEVAFGPGRFARFQNGQRGLHACEGRAEFVGGIAEETFLAGDEAGEASGHLVDGVGEAPEFVVPAQAEA